MNTRPRIGVADEIARRLCEVCGAYPSDVFGCNRHRDTVQAREVISLVMTEMGYSHPEVAVAMNRPNHTTITTARMRALKKIKHDQRFATLTDLARAAANDVRYSRIASGGIADPGRVRRDGDDAARPVRGQNIDHIQVPSVRDVLLVAVRAVAGGRGGGHGNDPRDGAVGDQVVAPRDGAAAGDAASHQHSSAKVAQRLATQPRRSGGGRAVAGTTNDVMFQRRTTKVTSGSW